MKKMMILLICFLPVVFVGCARKIKSRQLMTISVGMDKQEIMNRLGEPRVVRGSMTNKYGQVIEVWEYYVKTGHTSGEAAKITFNQGALFLIGGVEETYWLFFHDNKLVQWGRAGDWDTAAHNIQEIRFR